LNVNKNSGASFSTVLVESQTTESVMRCVFFAVSPPSSIEPADVAALEFIKYTKGETATKQKKTKTGKALNIERGVGDC
jgi:hypothetical protein